MRTEFNIRNLTLEMEFADGKLRTLKREADVTIEGYVTTKEAATMLGVTQGRIQQLVSTGQLPSQKIGNTRLIPIAAVDEYKQNRPKPGWPKGKPRTEED